MAKRSHNFVETYEGLLGFGLDRQTDENTVICYLQMFADDQVMNVMAQQMSDEELEQVFSLITRLLKTHLSESQYHRLFLKDDHP